MARSDETDLSLVSQGNISGAELARPAFWYFFLDDDPEPADPDDDDDDDDETSPEKGFLKERVLIMLFTRIRVSSFGTDRID